ncbi:MAG TPA: [FeFe] hydrogenase H-cluster maturation GTPase HydF [Smithellaceae bacterium]|jgi:[FeFe] hydrogenase H-cluster maturation GTPase HydF|nr:[FeFe] hydrogenase H-cluster maturation GTPase HydF [Smithellaceae bacterium]HPL48863.1 [FeFe] hydrogenase H-cluster maturation GTPase HydF [Smithella sp.]HNY97116.1 [FeFe] hydrogenase H-cluster maturation GTPase HydF [Smithellaceae bacterium]HOG12188.1 [FeFe] hydrogenase H-cluster maturation GTPase HydF [Smithellaceae bacterium]HOQ72197.1 [FeFe] hydrogenase H-cluster maturation GTPase HydF [Smithellaceae bacterium]
MDNTPKANRLHIALLGRTNVGKSSLLNLMLGQDIAITSSVAGTTTDVVEKAMELLPIGPVLFLDTAGLDDVSELSGARLQKTARVFDRVDVIILVAEADTWTNYEDTVLSEAQKRKIPFLIVVNKIDLRKPAPDWMNMLTRKAGPVLTVSCNDETGRQAYLDALKQQLLEKAPADFIVTPSLIGDLLPPGGFAVLVVPIDLQAPKGRLILPQVQTIRDTLDNDATAVVVKERELADTLANLKNPPAIVVTDSQAILKVTADVPQHIPVTTFSILFARQKSDLAVMAAGAAAIEHLKPGDRVLIAEACSHHALEDDIGRVKIPRWLRQYVGGDLQIDTASGRDYPADLKDYKLVLHCGACMINRREMLTRLHRAQDAGVPVTNYGVAISFLQGVLKRSLALFPFALLALEKEMGNS